MKDGATYWLRHLGATALLVSGARFSAFEFEGWQAVEAQREATAAVSATAPAKPPDLEKIKEMEGSELATGEVERSVPSLRRILVDWGPERSKVFVNGHYVGETPYGGQVACAAGDYVAVVVLPPSGAPASRSILCHGHTMAATDSPSQTTDAGAAIRPAEHRPSSAPRPVERPQANDVLPAASAPSSQQGTDPPNLSPETLELLGRALEKAQRDAERR